MFRRKLVKNWKLWLEVAIGLVLITAGILLFATRNRPETTNPPASGKPSAAKPGPRAVDSYVVPPDLPKYLSISSINVPKTRVRRLGLLKDNHIAAPGNIFDTGWYNGSAKPGETGVMFIFGHVSSGTTNGIFYDLKNIKPGDRVDVERGDGQRFAYTVKTSRVYPADKVDMGAVLTSVEPGKQGLNLMTCAGHVDKVTGEFSERLVVFASRD